MHGNIWEWCKDWSQSNYYTVCGYCTDPQGPEGPTNSINKRVRRGGSYSNNPNDCRAAYRNELDPATNYNDIGFRVALVHEEPEPDPEP